jgi:hypothetical protein
MEARGEMAVTPEDVQVAAKPQRRSFTAEYKRRILKEADACRTPGAVGALLRREGLYSSRRTSTVTPGSSVVPAVRCRWRPAHYDGVELGGCRGRTGAGAECRAASRNPARPRTVKMTAHMTASETAVGGDGRQQRISS